jgi:hypothetical protein
MEARTKRQSLLLAVLVVLLGGVLYWNLSGDSPPAVATKPTAPGVKGRPTAPSFAAPPDVSLQALEQPRPDPAEGDRNPFRFKPKAPPPPPVTERAQGQESSGPDAQAPAPPQGPPPPPAIPLKFIGIVEESVRHRRIAALSDGRFTYYGREGDIIEGRYRIVKIGVESIDMVHVDGRGPQTIRLSGS